MSAAKTVLEIGDKVLIRTVTLYYTGKIAGLGDDFLALEEAAWIADTGRYHAALAKGLSVLEEIEPYPGDGTVFISRGAIIDVAPWDHDLPRIAK